MEKEIAIRVENLSKCYKIYEKPIDRLKESINLFGKKYHHEFYALQGASFEINKGDFIGIVGKNGSGKSTLLKMITGVVSPTSGNIKVNGRISALLELGAGFNPEFTGLENIYMNGTIMGYSRDEMNERLGNIIDFAGIGDFLNQPVKMYSSGMFARLAFALSINVDPDILIVDEALAVGDVRFQQKCYAKFEEFRKLGKTILFVSHSLDVIKMYCSKAILLNEGRLLQEGKPKDVVDSYLKILRNLDEKNFLSGSQKKSSQDKKADLSAIDLVPIENSMWYNPNEVKYGLGGAEYVNVKFNDKLGQITNTFEVSDYFYISLEFLALRNFENLYFSYAIRNIQGIDLFVYNGIPGYENCPISDIVSGNRYKIDIKQKAFLVPGNYTISIALAKEENGEFNNIIIRYDVFIIKFIDSSKRYAGIFYDEFDIGVEKLN